MAPSELVLDEKLVRTDHFAFADTYDGLLIDDAAQPYASKLYGFDSALTGFQSRVMVNCNALWGYVISGAYNVGCFKTSRSLKVEEGEFFSLPQGGSFEPIKKFRDNDRHRMIVVENAGYLGYRSHGGPIEAKGRMRYIDTCSDTLLCAPMIKGDPCLNHLHFPPGIDQTQHTHPSTRMGVVARGRGVCITPDGEYPLRVGRIFYIPTNGLHRFKTFEDESMDVIAYHPDSDFGPTHENHPMINRTLVGGEKMDNTQGRHLGADFIRGRSDGQ